VKFDVKPFVDLLTKMAVLFSYNVADQERTSSPFLFHFYLMLQQIKLECFAIRTSMKFGSKVTDYLNEVPFLTCKY